jgi:two-component system response regulator AdeR
MSETMDAPTDEPDGDQPSVLVVDDERRVADMYAEFLDGEYDTTVAYDGEEALEAVDPTVDVVLLDRRMPGRSGDEVLRELRRRGLDCPVAMVTAVEPDFDIIEMPFDDYLVKPASSETIHRTVGRLLLREELDEVEYELGSLRVKRNVLEAEMRDRELEDSEEFARLEERIAELRRRLTELHDRLGSDFAGEHGTA